MHIHNLLAGGAVATLSQSKVLNSGIHRTPLARRVNRRPVYISTFFGGDEASTGSTAVLIWLILLLWLLMMIEVTLMQPN